MAIDMESLKRRVWPQPCFPIGHEVAGRVTTAKTGSVTLYDDNGVMVEAREGVDYKPIPYPRDYMRACYVEAERVSAVPLPATIEPGSMAISGLAAMGGWVYGVTEGEAAHVFAYEETGKRMTDLGVIGRNLGRMSIAGIARRRVCLASASPEANALYLYEDGAFRRVPLDIQNGVVALLADRAAGLVYGLSGSGDLFAFDPAAAALAGKQRVGEDGLFSAALGLGADGAVYGAGRWGRLYRYEARRNRVEPLGLCAPCLKGREYYNRVECLVADAGRGCLYGGTSGDGLLFALDVNRQAVRSVGKPVHDPRIRCLALGAAGAVYGLAGTTCCRLFRYASEDHDLADLGIFHVDHPRPWHGYEFGAAVCGNSGILYFGEQDRISHLFRYDENSKLKSGAGRGGRADAG